MKNISLILILISLSISKSFTQTKHVDTMVVDKQSKYATTEWKLIAGSTDGTIWYMKSEYVNKNRGEIKIWVKIKLPSSTIKKKVYKNTEEKWLLLVDCENKRIKILSTVTYSSGGKVIDNETIPDPDYNDVVPDTVMESIQKKICSHFN